MEKNCPNCGSTVDLKGVVEEICRHCNHRLKTHRVYRNNRNLLGINQGYKDAVDTMLATLMTKDQQYIDVMVDIVDSRDGYTGGHQLRVMEIAVIIAQAVGVGLEELELLKRSAKLHDVGKVHIPDEILRKPTTLTPDEMKVMELHTIEGAKILGKVKDLAYAVPVARHHHERWDGTGYPDKLKGDKTHLWARIVGIADSIDSMYITRLYRVPMFEYEIKKELRHCSGTQFDPSIIDAISNDKRIYDIFRKLRADKNES